MSKGKKFREYKAKAQMKLALPVVLKMAREASKDDVLKQEFLAQLKPQWIPYVKQSSTIGEEMQAIEKRIKQSGLAKAFEVAGITSADIRKILEEIRSEKFGPSDSSITSL